MAAALDIKRDTLAADYFAKAILPFPKKQMMTNVYTIGYNVGKACGVE